MAYNSRSRSGSRRMRNTSGRRKTTNRGGNRKASSARSRRYSGAYSRARGVQPRTVRIEVVQTAQPQAAPSLIGLKPATPPAERRF